MNFDVEKRTILKVKHGSHAYGLNTPESDIDYRGVCIEPFDHTVSVENNFEQLEEHVSKGFPVDSTIFGLFKFIRLAIPSNPNVLEILFVEESEIEHIDEYGYKLINIRDKFLSKKAFFTFGAYSRGQLKRLENHRKWIINPPNEPPSRIEFGLPASSEINADQKKAAFSAIQKKLDKWNFKDMSEQDKSLRIEFTSLMSDILAEMELGKDVQFKCAGRLLGFETNFLEVLDKERRYKNLQDEYANYLKWQKERNKKRYETEVKCLCDTKHASHLIRLYYEAIDLLNGNGLILKRPKEERQFLLDIKQGKFEKETFNVVSELQKKLDIDLNKALINSKLPQEADIKFIDNFMRELYLEYWNDNGEI